MLTQIVTQPYVTLEKHTGESDRYVQEDQQGVLRPEGEKVEECKSEES